jgi:hypothetical protein
LDSQLLNFSAVQVACFPFDDHNCPPLQLVAAFCQSASSWLKEDLQNVVVVHCKAGMARTGLMITSLLLYLKVLLIMCACVGMRWHITNNHQVMTVQLHFVKIHADTHIVILQQRSRFVCKDILSGQVSLRQQFKRVTQNMIWDLFSTSLSKLLSNVVWLGYQHLLDDINLCV